MLTAIELFVLFKIKTAVPNAPIVFVSNERIAQQMIDCQSRGDCVILATYAGYLFQRDTKPSWTKIYAIPSLDVSFYISTEVERLSYRGNPANAMRILA
jgi:hypothetical protein